MRINTINNYTPFKSKTDDSYIAYDDEISQGRRSYIRSHYDSWHMPYQSIYEHGHTLTDYQLKLLFYDLSKSHSIEKIGVNNLYRGQTLVDRPNDLFILKSKGINKIIDLVGYGKFYEDSVKQAGMKYYEYSIFDNWWERTDFTEPKFIEEFVNFIKEFQDGNAYIGCQHGANDTDIAMILNNFFNPLMEDKAKTKISPSDSEFPIRLNTIYDALTKEHKIKLGWDYEFEKKLIKKLISI